MKHRLLLLVFSAVAWLQPAVLTRAQTTLADGLDATDLVWTTGGTTNSGWFYEPDWDGGVNSMDAVDSVRSGRIGNSSVSWLQTTVAGPGTISFWWKAWSQPNADWLQFYVGADLKALICSPVAGSPSDWEYCSFPVPAGTVQLKWQYSKDYTNSEGTQDCGWVDQVRYVTTAPPPLGQALNSSGAVWNSSGSVYPNGWFSQAGVTHDGQLAAQSGAVWHKQTNWLQTVVSGVTNVGFWWKVSSEQGFDFLEFYTNGVLARQISGEVSWTNCFFRLPSSTNTLTWLYRKDDSCTAGSDCGWLDQVSLGGTLPPLPYTTLRNPVRLADGRIQFTVDGDPGVQYRVEFATNLWNQSTWKSLTNVTSLSGSTVIIDSGAPNSPARFYRTVSQ